MQQDGQQPNPRQGRRSGGYRGRPRGRRPSGGNNQGGNNQGGNNQGSNNQGGSSGAQSSQTGPAIPSHERPADGYLEITKNGAGVLRHDALTTPADPIIPANRVRELGLRAGDLVEGIAKGATLIQVEKVNGHGPEGLAERPNFNDLTAIHPEVPIILGTGPNALTGRLLDLIAPVGRGQRGLIVAPPKAGKTTVLRDIALGAAKDPEIEILVALIGERPEEVTHLRREIPGKVLAADLDAPPAEHTRVAQLTIDHARRRVEEGAHVIVLIDSLTRLARAYNLSVRGAGRTLSGGIDAAALQPVRQIFGSARATEEAGTLTIIATCLVDTGSALDDLVYEEFKGTGNMEVHLDRKLAQQRLFPAVDIQKSSTRREELLMDPDTLQRMHALRRKLAGVPADKALSALLTALQRQAAGDGSGAAEALAEASR